MHELEQGAASRCEHSSMFVLERVPVLKSAGVVAHLQALDRALIDLG